MPNEINLFGEIGGQNGVTAQQVKTQLAKMDQAQELVVRIDSPGGSVFDGLSIHDAFANYPGPKKAVIESTAMSIASYIAMAFDEVEITENGYVMIHEPYGGGEGTASDLRKDADLLAKLDQSMVAAYSRKTGLNEEQVRTLMRAETFYNASEALDAGFVNRINATAIPTRIKPTAQHTRMPQRVYAALFGATSTGDESETTKEKSMSTQKPVAASIKDIKAALPKMTATFYVRAMEEEMTTEQAIKAASEELAEQNEELLARVAALEEELVEAKAKAKAESDDEPEAEGEDEMDAEGDEEVTSRAKAGARGKAQPVARKRSSAPTASATQRWNEAIDAAMITAKSRFKAVALVNKKYPGLRDQMIAEAN